MPIAIPRCLLKNDSAWGSSSVLLILPFVAVVVQVVAWWQGSVIDWLLPNLAAIISAGLAGCLLLRSRAGIPVLGPWLTGLVLGWLGWGVVQALLSPYPALSCSRVGVDAAAVLAFLTIVRWFDRHDTDVALEVCGLGAVLGLCATISASQVLGTPHVGTGYVNGFLAVVIPAITAWCVWRGTAHLSGVRPGRDAWLVVAVLALVSVWAIFAMPGAWRRGVALAMAGGFSAACVPWIWRRWRWVGLAGLMVCAILMTAMLVIQVVQADAMSVDSRSLRLLHWKTAWAGIVHHWPLGGGAWASYHLGPESGDSARVGLALGESVDHVHNEYLSILLEHGLIGGLLMIGMTGIAVFAVLRCPDARRSATAAAILGSLGAMFMIENAFSLPLARVWIGVLLGLVGGLTMQGSSCRTRGAQGTVVVLIATGLCILPILNEAPAALLSKREVTPQYLPALRSTGIPQVAESLLRSAAELPTPNMGGMGEPLTAAAMDRLGPGPPLVWKRYMTMRFLGSASLAVERSPSFALLDSQVRQRMLADRAELLSQWHQSAVLMSERFMFEPQPYLDLALLAPFVSGEQTADYGRLLRRSRLLVGDGPGPDIALTMKDPVDLDEVADLWAACIWWTKRDPSNSAIDHAMPRLLGRYGYALRDVRLLAAVRADFGQEWTWKYRSELCGICARSSSLEFSEQLALITDPHLARTVFALLSSMRTDTHESETDRALEKLRLLATVQAVPQ